MIWKLIVMNNKTVFRVVVRPVLLLAALLLTSSSFVIAQSLTCPALVAQALSQMSTNCEGLERNFGCYGHSQVFASFVTDLSSDTFSQPGDRVALSALSSIQTSALDLASQRWGAALLSLQANLPNMLPGQGVVLLLLGDVTVDNAVSPDQMLQLGDGTPVITNAPARLRSGPGLDSNVVATVDAGTILMADSVDQTHDWLRVVYEGETAWIGMGTILAGDQTASLPVLAPDRKTPMQAFQVHTGLGAVSCGEAPSVLAVQSPDNLKVSLTLNGVDIQVGSLVTIQSLSDSEMRLTVHHGGVELADGTLVMPDETLVAQVNPEGNITTWAPPRPATPEEQAIGVQVQTILDNLNNPTANQPPPASWTIGQSLQIVNPDGAWQRQTPDSASTVIVAVLPNGTPVVVSGGPQWDGVQWWWQVRTADGRSDGWVEQSQLAEQAAQPSSACAPRADWAYTYTVQRGDTLFRIAQQAGVSLTELQTANCISDPSAIAVGQVLRVPQPVQPPRAAPPAAPSGNNLQQQPPPPTATEVPKDNTQPSGQQPVLRVTLVPSIGIIKPLPTATPIVIR